MPSFVDSPDFIQSDLDHMLLKKLDVTSVRVKLAKRAADILLLMATTVSVDLPDVH